METQMSRVSMISPPLPGRDLSGGEGPGSLMGPAGLGEAKARELVQLFKLLGDETRLRIVHYLMQQSEMNVRTFCRLLRQSQPAVSHHLALLRAAGVIDCRRDGKHNFYRLILKQCQAYLDAVFALDNGGARPIVANDSVLTFGRDAQ